MVKGFLATLGGLLAIGFVLALLVLGGAFLAERGAKQTSENIGRGTAQEVFSGYQSATQLTLNTLQGTASYSERVRLRPGYESLYKNWEADREKCAKYVPHEDIYKVDERLAEIERLTRP